MVLRKNEEIWHQTMMSNDLLISLSLLPYFVCCTAYWTKIVKLQSILFVLQLNPISPLKIATVDLYRSNDLNQKTNEKYGYFLCSLPKQQKIPYPLIGHDCAVCVYVCVRFSVIQIHRKHVFGQQTCVE